MTAYGYDSAGRVVAVTNALGKVEQAVGFWWIGVDASDASGAEHEKSSKRVPPLLDCSSPTAHWPYPFQ